MNEEDFIIISSDEENDANDVSKELQIPRNDATTEQAIDQKVDCSKKDHSILKATEQGTAECLNIPVVDEKNNFSTTSNLNISAEPGVSDASAKTKINIERDDNRNTENGSSVEVSPNFNKFLELVLSIEEKSDDKLKLKRKITKYHNLADPKYLKSEEFNNLLANAISTINNNQLLLYEIIKEILDCLLSKRIFHKSRKTKKMKSSDGEDDSLKEEGREGNLNHENDLCFIADAENEKIVKRLIKALKKLGKKIKELEEAEVDLSDEEDSSFFRMQRCRERFCQVYKKLCSITNQSANGKRVSSRKISFNGTNNLQLDRAIESWLNKTNQFPDYASVLNFIRESNESLSLGWSKEKLKNMAVDVFTKIGNSLQLRRKYDLWESFNSFLESKVDPSVTDSALRKQLDSNFEAALKKEKEILNYYAELQDKNRLEPAEVRDEEANCSPVESGDEDEKEIEAVENDLNTKIPIESEDDKESDDEESDQENVNSLPAEAENADAIKSNSSLNCVPNILDIDKNDESSRTELSDRTEDKEEMKGKSGECGSLGVKRFQELEITQCVKKPKLTGVESRNNDSDCEIVVLSDDETNDKSEKNDSFVIRKVHQINYTFVNNSFNHNATLTMDDLMQKRKNTFSSFKYGKNQRRSLPLTDLTNIKHITNKYARIRGGLEKRKIQESIRVHPFERSRFKYSQFILPDKMSNHCALQKESSSKNVKSGKDQGKSKEKDSCEESSNEEPTRSANYGGSGGGNGEDNNEDKRPQKRTEDKQEVDEEEKKEEEEDEEEVREECQIDSFNGIDTVESNGNTEADDMFISPQQLVSVTFDPPQPKRKSVAPKAKINKARVYKNGAPSTSGPVSSRHLLNCKPHVGNVKPSRARPRQSFPLSSSDVEILSLQQKKQAKAVKTDEEIVKNFLQHSPSSISITSPRKRLIENKPSPSILQAIQTLSRLKSITTTVVKASCPEREEDVTVIGESPKTPKRSNASIPKSRRNQSFVLPKIVTVQGNVSGFESIETDNGIGKLPAKKSPCPGLRRNQRSQFADKPGRKSDEPKQKQSKKNVEYVVLD